MPSDRDRSDRALVAAIEARDADALAKLYDRHAARLLGLAQRILGDTGEAEEVVQETFLYAWKAASAFDHSRGSVLAWLIVATRSRSIDRLRTRKPAAARGPDDADPLARLPAASDVEADSAAREWEAHCRAAIGGLPAEQREATSSRYLRTASISFGSSSTGSPSTRGSSTRTRRDARSSNPGTSPRSARPRTLRLRWSRAAGCRSRPDRSS